MRVIAKKILQEFRAIYADSEQQLKTWYKEASNAEWNNPRDIKSHYAKASILKGSRAVFNICSNNYRLLVEINYKRHWIFIRFIGTPKEYDNIDADNI